VSAPDAQALARRRREVLDVFTASEWAKWNMRITGENWSAADHEPDSLGLVEVVMVAEKAYGIEIRDETFMHCKTLGDVAEVIAAQVEQGGRPPLRLVAYDASLPMRAPAVRS
jgi:acyl carrier protein